MNQSTEFSVYAVPGLAERLPLKGSVIVPGIHSSVKEFHRYYDNVVQIVSSEFGVDPNDLRFRKTRKREVILPRQIAIAMIMQHKRGSLTQIGDYFNKDHATVLHSVKVVDNLRAYDKNFSQRVSRFFQS